MRYGRLYHTLLILFIFVLLEQSPGILAQQDCIGKVVKVRLPAEIVRTGGKLPIPAKVGFTLKPGDAIRTRENGICMVSFPDGSQMALRGMDKNAYLTFHSIDQITLAEGQLWLNTRGEKQITINTPPPTGRIYTLSTQTEIVLTILEEMSGMPERESTVKYSEIAVIGGEATLANSMGSIRLGSSSKGRITLLASPMKAGELTSDECEDFSSWVDFDTKSILVFVMEKELGTLKEDNQVRQEIEKILEKGHYKVLRQRMTGNYRDQESLALEKKAASGDMVAARKLAQKMNIDLYVTGMFDTKILGEAYQGLTSCAAHGEIKVYQTEGDVLLVSRMAHATDIERDSSDASCRALEKVVNELTRTVIFDVNQSLSDLIEPIKEFPLIEVVIHKCSKARQKIIFQKLKNMSGTKKIESVPPFREKMTFLVQTTASSRAILNHLVHIEGIGFKLIGIEPDKVVLEILEK